MNTENKMMLIAYAMFAIAGIISGIASAYAPMGWIIGWAIYIISPKILIAIVKDIPEELKDERVLLKKTFWSFFFFWLYFTGMFYTIAIKYQPVAYYNQTIYYNVTKG
ncbi:hypothetical protein [Pyrococcus kukulkanii]|uniref:Uncharacterized protein n=1 Tax=Pyrococcus kukulkanii TaxID=1609559 RepID=A0A127BC24_9EURY|nr:hypothetical protein [Pyrococcus kukulkanii]AMM54884.1 hypothetical protein TQ32_10610 [Pyrococcus kukulkanii]